MLLLFVTATGKLLTAQIWFLLNLAQNRINGDIRILQGMLLFIGILKRQIVLIIWALRGLNTKENTDTSMNWEGS